MKYYILEQLCINGLWLRVGRFLRLSDANRRGKAHERHGHTVRVRQVSMEEYRS